MKISPNRVLFGLVCVVHDTLHNSGEKIVAGMGLIENDFHDKKDLSPNVCAVYTEEEHRCQGIC